MPRRNRNTVKTHHRIQRPKWMREMEQVAYRASMNPRYDERGQIRPWATVLIGLLLIIAAMILAVLPVYQADGEGNPYSHSAEARRLDRPQHDQGNVNPVLYVEHMHYRWWYVELGDGSSWAVVRCRHEDQWDCWWNAKRWGNGEGRSFVNIEGRYHLAVKGTVIDQ